jgi:preprotein translocase subunit SecA
MASSNERIIKAKQQFCAQFQFYSTGTSHEIQQSVNKLLKYKNCTESIEILSTLNYYLHCAHGSGNRYEDQRVCTRIRKKEPEKAVFYSLLEDVLLNTPPHKQLETPKWRRKVCYIFAGSVLPHICFTQSHQIAVKHTISLLLRAGWNVRDLYLLIKALAFVFQTEKQQDVFMEFLVRVQCRELTSDSVVSLGDSQHGEGRQLTVGDLIRSPCVNDYNALIMDGVDCITFIQNCMAASEFCKFIKRNQTVSSPGLTQKQYDQAITKLCESVSGLLVDRDCKTQAEIIATLNHYSQCEREDGSDAYADQRVCLKIKLKEPASFIFLCVLEDILRNSNNSDLNQSQNLSNDWRKAACRMFVESVLPNACTEQRRYSVVDMMNYFLSEQSWSAHDIYYLMKALTLVFKPEEATAYTFLLVLRSKELTPVSEIRYSDNRTLSVRDIILTNEIDYYRALINEPRDIQSAVDKIERLSNFDRTSCYTVIQKVACYVENIAEVKLLETFDAEFAALGSMQDDDVNVDNRDKTVKLLQVLCEAVRLSQGYTPRITQLVSVLVFLWKPTSDEARRCLIEIKSAEGKSCILAMTAAALALMGHKVDIVTSSPLLARRDSDNWQLFYRLLRISSGCNEEVKADDNFYLNKTVIYGTIRYFARDVLRTKFLLENVRDAERGFDVVLLDEADSMLLDQSRQCTYLSHDVACSGLNHLQPIFALIWLHLSKCTLYAINKDPTTVGLYYYAISPKIFYKYLCDENDVGFHFGTEQELIKQAAHILHPDIESMSFEERKRTITSISSGVVVSFIKSLTMHSVDVVIKVYRPDLLENTCCEANVNFVGAELIQRTTHRILVYDGGMVCPLLNTQELAAMLLEEIKSKIALSDDDVRRADKFVVPVFLRQYVQDRLPVWIASAMKARRMTKDKEYTVYVDKYIYPVDYLSTGVTEVNKRFGDGLQQFLELKHGLPLTPVPFLTNYLSNYGFLKLYANILGASATLGVDAEHAILKQCYDVEIVNDIPMHVAKLFYQIEGILRDTEEEWLNALYSRIAYWKICTDKRGAFLVLCEDIQTAENLYEYLLVANARYSFESWKVKLFCHGVRTVGSLGMNTLIECGDIFITTNLGSRGTDYQIDKELKDTYGLHVIIGFLPYNIRVQEQAFGRTSRQGAPGVGQLIVNKQKLPAELADCNTLEDALKMRDKLNRIRLETIGHIIKRLDIRDELFTVFCTILEEKVAEWDELGLSTEDKRIKRDSLNEIWAQWLETVMPALLTTSADEDIQSLKEHLDRVINDKLKLLSDNKCHNSNFYHVLNFASNAMSSRQYDLAMSYYDDIIKNYNEWSAFAHYNRAHCHMYLRRDEHCVEDALKDLESTKARLKANKTEAMYVMLPAELSTDSLANTFRKKFRIRCQILDYLDKTIAFGIDLLKNRCQDWSSTVYDDQLTSISSKDMKISYMCTDSDVTEILLELQEMGLRYVYKMNAFVVPISASNVESLCNLSCAITQIASFMQSLGIDAATLDPIAIASKCEAGCFSLVKDLSLACESWGVGEAIAQCFSTSDGSKRHDTDCISLAVQIVADTLGNGTDKSDEFDKTSGDCSLQLKLKNEDESIQNVFERALNVIRRIVTLRVRQALRNNQPLHDRLAALYVMCINQNQQNEWISVIDNLATKVNVLKWVKVENNILSHQQVSRKNDRQQSNLFNELVSGGQNQFYFSIAEDVVRLKQVVDSDGRVDIDTAVPLLTCTTIIADNTEVSVKNFLDQLAEDISQLYSKCDEMLWKNQVNALNYFERSAREDNAKDASKQELRIEPLFTRQTTDKTANILIEAIMADIDNNMRQAVVLVTSLKVLMHQLITNVTHPATSSVRPKRRLGRSAFDDGLFEVKTQSLVASHKLAFFLQYDVDSIDEDKWDLYRSYVASLNLNRTKQPESSNQPEPLTGGFPDVDVTLLTVVQPDGQHRIRHKHEYVIETSLKYDQHRENVRNFCEWARDFQQVRILTRSSSVG